MIQKTLVFCLSLAFMISCSSSPKDPADKHDTTHDHGHEHDHGTPKTAEDVVNDGTSTVTLNDGAKWKANGETTEGVEQMKRLITEFTDLEDVQAYESLQSDLKNGFSLIFQNCTMSGEAHNQLHHFLLPMQALMDGLTAGDLAIQKKNLNALDTRLKSYNMYFE